MKIRVTLDLEFPEQPDDRGTVDQWVAEELAAGFGQMETDELFDKLRIRWTEVRPRGRPRKVVTAE